MVALCGAMLASTLPQYSLGILAPILSRELGMAAGEFGILAACMYVLAAVISRFGGRHVDAMRPRLVFLLIFAFGCSAMFVLAGSVGRITVLAAGVVAGCGLGINNLATNRIIATSMPPGGQGLAIGLKQTGVKLAHLTAGGVLPFLVAAVGWRIAVASLALAGVVVGAVGATTVVGDGDIRKRQGTQDASGLAPQLRSFRLFAGAMAIGMSAVNTYLPLYAVDDLGLSLQRAGLLVVAFALCATVCRLLWAVAARRMRSPRTPLCLLSAGGVGAFAVIAAASWLGQPALWIGCILGGASLGAWNVVVQYSVIREVGARQAATGTGIVQSSFLLGLASGGPIFAGVAAVTGSFPVAWLGCACFAGVALAVASARR